MGIDRVGVDSAWNCARLGIVSIPKNLKINKFILIGLEMIGLEMIGLEVIGLEMIGLDMIGLEMIGL